MGKVRLRAERNWKPELANLCFQKLVAQGKYKERPVSFKLTGLSGNEYCFHSEARPLLKATLLGAIIFAVRNLIYRFTDQFFGLIFRFQGDTLADQLFLLNLLAF